MRGTPGGKQLATGSFVSARGTAFGPRLGLLALNRDSPQDVIEGFSVEIDIARSKMVYLRALSGGRRDRLHTPVRSVAGAAAWAFAAPDAAPDFSAFCARIKNEKASTPAIKT